MRRGFKVYLVGTDDFTAFLALEKKKKKKKKKKRRKAMRMLTIIFRKIQCSFKRWTQ